MGNNQSQYSISKNLSSITAIGLLFSIAVSCQSKYEKFQEQAPKAEQVTILFYQDGTTKKDYQGLKVTADSSDRIEQIVAYVKDSSTDQIKCSPIGHIIFSDNQNQHLFDLPFCLTNGSAYLQFSERYRPLSDKGKEFLKGHYKTFRKVRPAE